MLGSCLDFLKPKRLVMGRHLACIFGCWALNESKFQAESCYNKWNLNVNLSYWWIVWWLSEKGDTSDNPPVQCRRCCPSWSSFGALLTGHTDYRMPSFPFTCFLASVCFAPNMEDERILLVNGAGHMDMFIWLRKGTFQKSGDFFPSCTFSRVACSSFPWVSCKALCPCREHCPLPPDLHPPTLTSLRADVSWPLSWSLTFT